MTTPAETPSARRPHDLKTTVTTITPVVVIRALRESDIPHLGDDKKLRVFVTELPETGELAGRVLVGLGYPDYFPKLDDDTVGQMYLAGINVKPEFQRRGIGLQLLQFLKQEALTLGLHVFRAECEKGFLVDFYAKIGLEPVPYKGTHEAYPESHQMLELWLKRSDKNWRLYPWEKIYKSNSFHPSFAIVKVLAFLNPQVYGVVMPALLCFIGKRKVSILSEQLRQ